MATTLASIISQARTNFLQEPAEVTNGQWTDAALLAILSDGVKDLYRALKDTYQDFFFTLDETNVSMPANTFTLTGVPADVFIVLGIEPRDVATYTHVKFTFKQFTHPDFRAARSLSSRTLQSIGDTCEIYYDVVGAGAPVSAPTIYAAPKLTAALLLRLIYVPTLTLGSNNPIPGESDMALQLWTAAYARAKTRDDQSPDPNLLELYQTEKVGITIAVSPRDESDVETVEDFFQFDSDN